jgi:hypothetical protein
MDHLPARSFFQRTDWLSFSVTVLALLVVYLWTMAPEVTLEWSGILASGAAYGSAPSPPGSPLWVIYAWVFANFLPFSNIAWRIAVSSAVAGAFACGVIALIVSRGSLSVVRGVRGLHRLPLREEQWLRGVCGSVAGVAFGFHKVFWSQAVIVETTTLAMLLFAVTIALLMRWARAGHKNRFLYGAAFVFGLSLNVRISLAVAAPGFLFLVVGRKPQLGRDLCCMVTIALTGLVAGYRLNVLPELLAGASEINHNLGTIYALLAVGAGAVCVFLVFRTRRLLTEWRPTCMVAVSATVSLVLYFYTAVASMPNPPVNWAYPRTVEGFIHLISRGQFEGARPVSDLFEFASQIWDYGRHTIDVFGWMYLLAAVPVFYFLPRMRRFLRRWVIGLLGLFVCLSLFNLAMLNPSRDRLTWSVMGEYFVASHMVLAIFAGFGLALIAATVSERSKLKKFP